MINPIKDKKRIRVIRSGAWNFIVGYVQPSARVHGNGIGIGSNLSFRIVRNK